MPNRTGEYIITEGTDATGKTTVANLLAQRAYDEGHEVIRVDEPDSAYRYNPSIENPEPLVPIASEIRRVIKDGSLGRTALTNLHLFTAARAANWNQVIRPALEDGAWVIGARNWLSSVVYQGYTEGYGIPNVEAVTKKAMGLQYLNPDHLFILDLNDETERARRIAERGPLDTPDTFESRGDEFQQQLIAGYREIARTHGITLTDASRPKQELADELWTRIQNRIARRPKDTPRVFTADWRF